MMAAFRKMVGHFKKSNVSTHRLITVQKDMGISNPLKLVQDVPQRWNSGYFMLARSIELKKFLILVISELKIPIEISARMWELAEQVYQVLGVFYDATKAGEGDFSPISQNIPTIVNLKKAMKPDEQDSDPIRKMKKSLRSALKSRFKSIEKNEFLLVATLLDPRFKAHYFSDDKVTAKAKKLLAAECDEVEDNTSLSQMQPKRVFTEPPPAKRRCLWDYDDPEPEESPSSVLIEDYLRVPRSGRKANPLDYWKTHPSATLKKVVRKYLCVPASSAPSERVFSNAGLIVTHLRTRLSPEKVEMLLFLNRNIRFLEGLVIKWEDIV